MLRILCFILTFSLVTIPVFADNKSSDTTSPSLAEQNLAESKAFLEANKHKPGVITLPSGLQYKELTQGAGASPQPTDFVTVRYKGTLMNGKEFDKSLDDKTPPTFAVNAVIPGWTEALQLMKPGARWIVYIPPQLGYGARGAGRLIGPNALLIFEIDLIAVKPSLENNTENNPDESDDVG